MTRTVASKRNKSPPPMRWKASRSGPTSGKIRTIRTYEKSRKPK